MINLLWFFRKSTKKFSYLLLFFCLLKLSSSTNVFKYSFFKERLYFTFIPIQKAGRLYLIPTPLSYVQSYKQMWSLFLKNAKQRKEKSFPLRIYSEYLDYSQERGLTFQYISQYYKTVFSHRQYIRFLKKKRKKKK